MSLIECQKRFKSDAICKKKYVEEMYQLHSSLFEIGAFHAPKKIFIWTGFLNSLSAQALYSGYGEILKFVLIAGKQDFMELMDLFTSANLQIDCLRTTIYQSLTVKKDFIQQDEFDTGVRRLLNYGHTFGHALELITDYAIPHGIAVTYGIDIANYIALNKKFIDETYYESIHEFIKHNFFANEKYTIDVQLLIKHTRQDKKNSNDKLNMVFLKKPGELFI